MADHMIDGGEMRKMRKLVLGCSCIASFLLLFASTDSEATEISERALLGRTMWSAFECGAFGESSGQQQEAERLYSHGIGAGRQFLQAIRAGSPTEEELRQSTPVGVMLRLGGDSDDFIIGRIFEAALEEALAKVWYDADDMHRTNPRPETLRKLEAEASYGSSNCELMGH
ncbi:MAG: hypothetical protein F4Y02_08900 [Chloroflexi bacterium]|nr:hypothetical protein [Chloroflexota bacterium]